MGQQKQETEKKLTELFYSFIENGMQGRFEEALSLMADGYMGVGMGEQGIVRNKDEAKRILQNSYTPTNAAVITFEVKDLTIKLLSADVAVIFGEVIVTNTPPDRKPMHSGLMQTINARCIHGEWRIAFTHASPTILTAESIEAYPIHFMEQTLSALRADLRADASTHCDPLTGILNREGLDRCVARLMQDYNPKHNTALFMIDLDDFKQINDRLGHQTGDAVLQQVAAELRNTFRECDAVSRLGGDEFMVLLTGDFSGKFLEKKAEELLKAMRLRMNDGQEVPISISIGIAYGRARATFEKLYHIADIALYAAKKAGKCRYHLINSDTNAQRSYSGSGTNLLSLQTLLNYTGGKEILASKTPYEALVDNIPGGVVMYEFTDTSINIAHCNEWFCRLLGYTEKEVERLEAGSPLALVHPDDVPLMKKAAESIRSGADTSNVIYRARHNDGSYSHINQISSVTERRSDSITVYGIEVDVEETSRLKQQVEDSQKELETFLNAIPGGVLSISLTDQLKLVHRNQWMSRFLGYSQQELDALENADALTLVHPDDIPLIGKAVVMFRNGAEDGNIVYRLRGKDGCYRRVRISVTLAERGPEELRYYAVVTALE